MAAHYINSDSLGDTTNAASERFARFCTVVAEKAGYDIVFEIDHKTSGYTPKTLGGDISNICWDCGWYGNGPLRKNAIDKAVKLVECWIKKEVEENE